jgi:hypothetical protein
LNADRRAQSRETLLTPQLQSQCQDSASDAHTYPLRSKQSATKGGADSETDIPIAPLRRRCDGGALVISARRLGVASQISAVPILNDGLGMLTVQVA